MIDLENIPFGNGGGSVKTLADVEEACQTPMTEIEVGSITMHRRDGNIGETYYFDQDGFWSLNALGLPNLGWEYYAAYLPEMAMHAHDAGKKLRANIAPFSPDECGQLAESCLQRGADSVVINGSCPNVWDGGRHPAVPALNPEAAEALLEATKRYLGHHIRDTWFKLSPTDDPVLVQKLVAAFRRHGVRKFVCCNTKGDQQRTREDGTPALAFRASEGEEVRHVGGLAGMDVQSDNLATARLFIQHMPEAEVIGLGGIFTGAHAKAYLDAKCVGFQATTGYLEFGGQLFVDIIYQLTD